MTSIVALIPCKDEAIPIAGVVNEIKRLTPSITVYVYDNNSSDNTANVAASAGAIVRTCTILGKGNVVNQMFLDIDADYYFMVDGDGTYSLSSLPDLLRQAEEEHIDMIIGKRSKVERLMHSTGNKLFNKIFNICFGTKFSDIFSGYRIMSRRLVKSLPLESKAFEIESELSIHCVITRAKWMEADITYNDRSDGSKSKLSTFKDGFKILCFILKNYLLLRPNLFISITFISFLAFGYCYAAIFSVMIGIVLNQNSAIIIENRRLSFKSYSNMD